jgi:putative methionine-R-sulfoxide reductase with GAF domain
MAADGKAQGSGEWREALVRRARAVTSGQRDFIANTANVAALLSRSLLEHKGPRAVK